MKKIMFNDRYGLTEAVLQGRKTVTRRLVTCPRKAKGVEVFGYYGCSNKDGLITEIATYDADERTIDGGAIIPPYKVGEIVAVAQSYFSTWDQLDWENGIRYKKFVSSDCVVMHGGWTNKQFVFAEDMPYQVRILDIRAERLQDITEEDCLREYPECNTIRERHINKAISMGASVVDNWMTRRDVFASLIDKISGKGTWERNPYVWRIEFELVK